MSGFTYDLVVIGSGPAGEKGAAQAAYFGKRVALVERAAHLGGAGINTGTVPSKTLRETALYFSGLRQRGLFGIDYSIKEGLTIGDFMYRERSVVNSEHEIVRQNLDRHGVDLFWGIGALEDPHTVKVTQQDGSILRLSTDIILVATGSSPHRPADVPFAHPRIRDSDSILRLDRIPRAMTVVGGGVIGVEYGSIFAALGVEVTLVEGHNRILPFVDEEIAQRLRRRLEGLGLRLLTETRVVNINPCESHVELRLSSGQSVRSDIALFAAGRQSNVGGLGLEALGVKLGSRGLILVNERYQTSISNIYAAGDVIGFPALASTSMEQARVAMVHAFDLRYKEHVSTVIPLAVYTIPEISLVGLTEDACRIRGKPYLVGRAFYARNARGQIIGDTEGLLKLVFSPEDKKLLGVHIIGEMASELIHLGAQTMASDGSIDAFINAVYNYPSLSDCYKYAAYDGLGELQRWQASERKP
jgi:NAD(P) transhydrogenase